MTMLRLHIITFVDGSTETILLEKDVAYDWETGPGYVCIKTAEDQTRFIYQASGVRSIVNRSWQDELAASAKEEK